MVTCWELEDQISVSAYSEGSSGGHYAMGQSSVVSTAYRGGGVLFGGKRPGSVIIHSLPLNANVTDV